MGNRAEGESGEVWRRWRGGFFFFVSSGGAEAIGHGRISLCVLGRQGELHSSLADGTRRWSSY